jgi:hypothetical protein
VSQRRYPWAAMLASAGILLISGCSSDAPTSPREISLSVTAAPAIGLSPTSLYFCSIQCGGSTRCCIYSSGYLYIKNVGGGTLNWTSAKNKTWLKRYPHTGTAPSKVKVWVDATGLTRGLTYYAYLTISATGASNSPQVVRVRLYVN